MKSTEILLAELACLTELDQNPSDNILRARFSVLDGWFEQNKADLSHADFSKIMENYKGTRDQPQWRVSPSSWVWLSQNKVFSQYIGSFAPPETYGGRTVLWESGDLFDLFAKGFEEAMSKNHLSAIFYFGNMFLRKYVSFFDKLSADEKNKTASLIFQNANTPERFRNLFGQMNSLVMTKNDQVQNMTPYVELLKHIATTDPLSEKHKSISFFCTSHLFKDLKVRPVYLPGNFADNVRNVVTYMYDYPESEQARVSYLEKSICFTESLNANLYIAEGAGASAFLSQKSKEKLLPGLAFFKSQARHILSNLYYYGSSITLLTNYPYQSVPDGAKKAELAAQTIQKYVLYQMVAGDEKSRTLGRQAWIDAENNPALAPLIQMGSPKSVQWPIWVNSHFVRPRAQAKEKEELLGHIKEAVDLFFEEPETVAVLNRMPKILSDTIRWMKVSSRPGESIPPAKILPISGMGTEITKDLVASHQENNLKLAISQNKKMIKKQEAIDAGEQGEYSRPARRL